jgi:hypothetical protein
MNSKMFFALFLTLVGIQLYIIIGVATSLSIINFFARLAQFVSLACLIGLSKEQKKRVFTIFVSIFAISLIPALIVFVINAVGVDLPFKILMPTNGTQVNQGIYFREYFGAVFMYSPYRSEIYMWRVCGMYNEPGVVGTFAAFILVITGVKIKTNWKHLIILIAGILSFSLAFYVILIVGLGIRTFQKNVFRFLPYTILIFSAYFIFMSINTNNIHITEFQSRITFENGLLFGDNRTDELFELEFDHFMKSDLTIVLFGMGDGASFNNPSMNNSSSYKSTIYDLGIVGLTLEVLWLVWAFWISRGKSELHKWEEIAIFVVFLLSIYQRPNIFDLGYFSILFCGIAYINRQHFGNSFGISKTSEKMAGQANENKMSSEVKSC